MRQKPDDYQVKSLRTEFGLFFGRHCCIQNLNFESCHIKSNESSKSVGFVTLVLLWKLFANPEE